MTLKLDSNSKLELSLHLRVLCVLVKGETVKAMWAWSDIKTLPTVHETVDETMLCDTKK